MDLVRHNFFAIGRDLHRERNRLAIHFVEWVGGPDDVSVGPSVQMLDNAHFRRGRLVVANRHLEALVH